MEQIRLGQGLLIICCVFYLIWWGVAFHPSHGDGHTSGTDGILLLITALVDDAGNEKLVSVEDAWLTENGLNVGSEWPSGV